MPVLDAIDRKILSHLQSDGRITMAELAEKVGLSVSPCHRRVKLLGEGGVIRRDLEMGGSARMLPDDGQSRLSVARRRRRPVVLRGIPEKQADPARRHRLD